MSPDTTKGKAPTREEVTELIRRFFDAFNKRDDGTIMEMLAEEHLDHTYFGKRPVRPAAVARAFKGMWDVFPDWHETIDEIIPGDAGTAIIRHTGRGTQTKNYMGKQPDGRQIAAPLITVVRVRDGKIVEYRSTFPFKTPFEETIASGQDVQEVRAEQGGYDIDESQFEDVLSQFAAGELDSASLAARRAELPETPRRCESLLAENMRRCVNNALPDSLYCIIHQEPGLQGGFGAP
jgi:steroid delta-isomerase-like uncharacterized protein